MPRYDRQMLASEWVCDAHNIISIFHQHNSWWVSHAHYDDVTIGAIASPITSLRIVYSTVYSDADQRKHQSSASLAFVWGIHREPVNSPHKWPVTRKMFPFDYAIMGNFDAVSRISSDCTGEISHNFLLLQIYPYIIIMERLEDRYPLARKYHCQIMFGLLDAIKMFADAYITLSSGHLVYGTWVWWIVCLFISHHLAFLGRQQGQWWLPI